MFGDGPFELGPIKEALTLTFPCGPFRPRLHEYVFIENDMVFNGNAMIVLHLHIVFVSYLYCSLWRPFPKVIVLVVLV